MMTSIYLILLLSFDFNTDVKANTDVKFNPDVKEVVKEYHELTNEVSEIFFIYKYQESSDASVMAYVISIAMKQAEYTANPLQKLQLFQENKDKLNRLIDTHRTNIHLRYVRLLSQENAPFFLGYNGNITEDKLILKNILEVEDETDYLDYYIRANTSL
jgi:hypothetical protein